MAVLILALNHGDIALSSAKNSADGRRTTRIGKHDATGTTTSRVQITHVHEKSYSLRHVVVGGVHTFRDLLGGKLLTGLQGRQEHQNAERDIRECCQTHGYSFSSLVPPHINTCSSGYAQLVKAVRVQKSYIGIV